MYYVIDVQGKPTLTGTSDRVFRRGKFLAFQSSLLEPIRNHEKRCLIRARFELTLEIWSTENKYSNRRPSMIYFELIHSHAILRFTD